jgi:SAM-dependent methyltransferase
MLSNIPKSFKTGNIHFCCGKFPAVQDLANGFEEYFDAILVYSVIQYVFLGQSIFNFIHKCIEHLKPGGRLLIGDIPNLSARNRFLNSSEGKEFSNNNTQISNSIVLSHSNDERIDDAVIFSILNRFRNFGCETYLIPQHKNLPFGNRREDLLIVKR